MNILLWILQILIALHTLAGGIWKFSQTVEQTMPSLSIISNEVWLGLGVIEIVCALVLIISLFKTFKKKLAPLAATFIALEMLAFCCIHILNGEKNMAPVSYWAVVAALSAFVAYGRLKLAKEKI